MSLLIIIGALLIAAASTLGLSAALLRLFIHIGFIGCVASAFYWQILMSYLAIGALMVPILCLVILYIAVTLYD
jgi:hypothetical protein